MKKLFIFILFSIFSNVSAGPSASIFHTHDDRSHSHPLPAQGISHRHGSGALGTSTIQSNQKKTYTGTVIFGNPRPVVKPPKPNRSVVIHTDPRIKSTTRQVPNRNHDFWNDNRRSNTYRNNNKKRIIARGDTSCRPGQIDCNVCAANVQHQFQKAASGQISWRNKPWRFNWPHRYPPHNTRPLDIFNGDAAYALGIPDKHVQGFVRTNSRLYPYAGSHSHKRRGGIFVIRQNRDGKKFLSSLHQTPGKHPSGVHIIGKYLVYGVSNHLYFKDINSANQRNDIRLRIPRPSFGGGLGALKLSQDSHLIITSGPGGQDSRQRFNRFYHLKSSHGRPVSITYLNESTTRNPSQWSRVLGFSENLSLITECGTGDIYVIHTTGDEKGMAAINGNGYWRLSKLMKRNNVFGLRAVNAFTKRQNMSSCNIRAAASVFVNPSHKLEFYCHGYAKDPDGSTFNVLGKSSRNSDKFYFKVGTVR